MKLWIAGSVAAFGEEENIAELVKTFHYFDGACFSVNYNQSWVPNSRVLPNKTFSLLEGYCKGGKILWVPWIKRHDISMNIFLKAGVIRPNDFFLYIDAQELPKKEFLENIHKIVGDCKKQNITAIHWNRPYFIQYQHDMHFVGNPHAWLQGIKGKQVNIADESKVKYDLGGVHFGDFIYNKKKFENSMLLSGVKYSLYDPPNNQFNMFYPGEDFSEHEQKRQEFCNLLDDLGYKRDLNGLEEFFRNKDNITDEIINYINFEWVFSNFIRYKIFRHSLDEIMKTRYNFKITKNDLIDERKNFLYLSDSK